MRYRTADHDRVDVTRVQELDFDPVWDGMPLADFMRFARYVRVIADALGFADWCIRLKLRPEGEDEEVLATMKVATQSRFATLRLSHTFADEPLWLQQETLIHEVLHLAFEPVLSTLNAQLPGLIGGATAETIDAFVADRKEQAIDQLAVALAAHLPKLPRR